MGYMGLGMQSWIYKQKPRKPFQLRRRPTFDALPSYDRTFKIQPTKQASKKRKALQSLSILVFCVCLLVFFASKFKNYERQRVQLNEERESRIAAEAYLFLQHSGMQRYYNNDIKGAYSEFKLAYKLNPKNLDLKQRIVDLGNELAANH